jgi:hypothetical protein
VNGNPFAEDQSDSRTVHSFNVRCLTVSGRMISKRLSLIFLIGGKLVNEQSERASANTTNATRREACIQIMSCGQRGPG